MPEIVIQGSATPGEAAAVSAAIERFLGDTAVVPPPAESGMDPWLKAALADGVNSKDSFGPGDPRELF